MKTLALFGALATAVLALPGAGPTGTTDPTVTADAATPAICIRPGAVCGGLWGSKGRCCPGSYCQWRAPNYSTCKKLTIPTTPVCLGQGATCVGIDGSRGFCCPGLECKFVAFDYSVCKRVGLGPSTHVLPTPIEPRATD